MTTNEKDWIKEKIARGVRDFVEYTKEDPKPLLAGAGTAAVLMLVGSAKLAAILAGTVVTGVLYSCREKRVERVRAG